MKKILLTLITGVTFYNCVDAQIVNAYGFSQSSGTYTPITGGTVLGGASVDEQVYVDPATPAGTTATKTGVGFPIGFNFTYNGIVFDRIGINTNGWISFGQSSLTPSVDLTTGGVGGSYALPLSQTSTATPALLRNRVGGLGVDLQGQTGSEIRIETTGTAPNRVCVIQWTSFRKYNNTGDNYNFQIRLNETTNSVVVVYGQMTNNTTSKVAQVGLSGTTNADFNLRRVSTNWSQSIAGSVNTDTCRLASSLVPASGQTYTWTVPAACSGTPTAGTASASVSGVCSGTNFDLILTGYSSGVSGLTFQWQSSSSQGGTYINISGATSPTYTTSITATTYYKCVVTCTNGGASVTSNVVTVNLTPATQCYCTPESYGGACITGVSVATLNRTSAACENSAADYYTLVPTTEATTTLATTLTYPLSVTVNGSAIISVWIDYNQNGTFDASEWTQVATNAASGSTSTVNITVPGTAITGQTRMRVRTRGTGSSNGATDACSSFFSGEAEDYTVTIGTATACSGTPTAGTATASAQSICSGQNLNLDLTGYSSLVSGLTFQWQSSSSQGGTYTNISGATNPAYTASQTAATYYKCVVTCTNGGASATSNAVFVDVFAPSICNYCANTYSTGCTSNDVITNVTIGTINNTTTCSPNAHAFYATTIPTFYKGATYPISVTVGSGGTERVATWIDYNQNGTFEATEFDSIGSGNGVTISNTITIPATAQIGTTVMRVRVKFSSSTPWADTAACTNTYTYGETEDYVVIIADSATIGIAENSILSTILVFPNPTNGTFTIAVPNADFNQLTINVIDIQGKVVYTATDKNVGTNYNKQINLEGIAKGLYYVKMTTEKGVKVHKLVVQ